MKSKFLFSCVVALAFLSGCIKEEGEELLVERTNVNEFTIVTKDNGFMEGEAVQDKIVDNYFTPDDENNNPCYTVLHSDFKNFSSTRNEVKEYGYVYSLTNPAPTVGGEDCSVLQVAKGDGVTPISSKDSAGTKYLDYSFDGKLTDLQFNCTYYVRSYAVCKGVGKADSVVYNSKPLEYKTVLPSDLWYERHTAPGPMGARKDAFHCEYNDDVYVYGGKNGNMLYNDLWKYDALNDTWQQMGTFETEVLLKTGPAKRCNGAMLAYPNPKASDVLLFVIGGEAANGEYTGKIFYYSTSNNRFADQRDHPNAGSTFTLHDDEGNPVYEYEYERNEDGSIKYENGNKVIAKDKDGNPIYRLDGNGHKIEATTSSSRNYIEELPIYKGEGSTKQGFGLAGCVAFSLTDKGFTKYFVAFGKTDASSSGQKHISTSVFEYAVENDWDRKGYDLNYAAWTNISTNKDKALEAFYQPVCVKCGDRIIIGSGESSKNDKVSNNFYTITYSLSEQNIRMEALPKEGEGMDEFVARANAAAFYLNYTKDNVNYDRFYVGTGRTCVEDDFLEEPEQLLNDFWCYDFVTKKWSRKRDCSSIVRQGAVGFTIKRADDIFVKNFGETNVRGMFSFGEGYLGAENGCPALNDNWEYIP
ncbi:MAG: hypothetical protein J5595_01365 [Bacteroidales bacterium]|nr:hypothetical protein [Bacteroidales bacterium]